MENEQQNSPIEGDVHLSNRERKELRKQDRQNERDSQTRSRATKRFGMWTGVILVVGFIVWGMISIVSYNNTDNGGGLSTSVSEVSESDNVKGNRDSNLVLIEYSDFQCPACRSFFPLVQQVAEEFGDEIAIVYRHFPLAQIHANATLAAEIAEAAGEQGMFWEMHDELFNQQPTWGSMTAADVREEFARYAVGLGLDMDQFNSDLDDNDVTGIVRDNYRDGLKAGVASTPTFFLNGQKMSGFSTAEEFISIIREEQSKL
ncbi:hypothetical protein COB55_00775 [Candidatus Wolfebacteria bacterium]|nr:MAG: hypothetical protein COB55_00775 [Candidatus Wolfebacteria bacterium]